MKITSVSKQEPQHLGYKGMNANLQALILKGAASPASHAWCRLRDRERVGQGSNRHSFMIHLMLDYSSTGDRPTGFQNA